MTTRSDSIKEKDKKGRLIQTRRPSSSQIACRVCRNESADKPRLIFYPNGVKHFQHRVNLSRFEAATWHKLLESQGVKILGERGENRS